MPKSPTVKFKARETRPRKAPDVKPYIAGAPTRNVLKPRSMFAGGYTCSIKLGHKHVAYTCRPERDAIKILETDNRVLSYQSQPAGLEYELQVDGRSHVYTPDFSVFYRDGLSEILEIKSQADAEHPDNEEFFEMVRIYYASMNVEFRVLKHESIRDTVHLKNAETLLRQKHHEAPMSVVRLVEDIFRVDPPNMLGDLVSRLDDEMARNGLKFTNPDLAGSNLIWNDPPQTVHRLYAMAIRNVFCIELDRIALCQFSPVYPAIPTVTR